MASIPNKKMRGRTILVAALLIIVGFGLVIHQLYRVQLVEGESYKQEAMSRQLRATTINANRGDHLLRRWTDISRFRHLLASHLFPGGYHR